MGKVFFRSMYVLFLWVIVLINLIFVFDVIGQIPLINSYTGISDYSNKYFGMSTMIKFIEELDMERDFPFLKDLRDWITTIQNTMAKAMSMNWSDVWDYPINNIVDFFVVVGNFFTNLFKGLGNIIIQISMIVFWIVYYALYLLAFWKIFLKLISGAYFVDVPSSGIDMPSINNIISLCRGLV